MAKLGPTAKFLKKLWKNLNFKSIYPYNAYSNHLFLWNGFFLEYQNTLDPSFFFRFWAAKWKCVQHVALFFFVNRKKIKSLLHNDAQFIVNLLVINLEINSLLHNITCCIYCEYVWKGIEHDMQPEFLKAAIMQSNDCTTYLRIWGILGLRNTNQEKWHKFWYIYHNLMRFSSFTYYYVIFYACFWAKFSIRSFGVRK